MTLYIEASPAQFHVALTRLARLFNGNRKEISLEFSDLPNRIYRVVNNGTLALDGQVGSCMVNVSIQFRSYPRLYPQ
ncbi:phage tail domain-containing protein [Paenibacillus terrigena]|uniref:phage tail domain-containing protein n=1 Tax=Paenibacillus terrigena TaxID=369333 RepID=UPI003CCBA0D9